MYVDGSSVTVSNSNSGTPSTFGNFTQQVDVGAIYSQSSSADVVPIDASLDEVAFYTTQLSSTRVAAHYAAGSTGVSASIGQATETSSAGSIVAAAWTFIGTSTASRTTSGTLDPSEPTGWASGDFLIAVVSSRASSVDC